MMSWRFMRRARWVRVCAESSALRGAAGLEYLQHALGDNIAASGVRGTEQHAGKADRLLEHGAGIEQGVQRAYHDDPVDEVRARHERRMQNCWNAADHLVSGEGGEHENVKSNETGDADASVHGDLRVRIR